MGMEWNGSDFEIGEHEMEEMGGSATLREDDGGWDWRSIFLLLVVLSPTFLAGDLLWLFDSP